MRLILWLHIILEGGIGILFLFFSEDLKQLPGFADGNGASFDLSIKLYGNAALFIAALGLIADLKRKQNLDLSYGICLTLSVFHFGLAAVLAAYHPDQRVFLLHFLMGIFLSALYVRRPK